MAEIEGEAEDDEEPPAVQPAKGKKGLNSNVKLKEMEIVNAKMNQL